MVHSPVSSPAALWPPDDTEASILGVSRHQLDIVNLHFTLNEEALRLAGTGPRPWEALTQILLLGCVRPDGSRYAVSPDVMVFPHAMNDTRGSYHVAHDGPPVLVIEVASEATHEADRDVVRGKGWTYAHAGVQEYLVLDPPGEWLAAGGEGWRLVEGVYRPWAPGADGHWHSETLPVAFGVEDGLAAVYDRDGRRLLREGEVGPALEAQRLQTKRETIRRVVHLRFGVLPSVEHRLNHADDAE